MANFKKFKQYFKEYEWSNIWAMIQNGQRDPLICQEDFKGKRVVITGATSGIGRLTALKYASQGAHLICINRNPEKSEALKKEVESQYGVTCETVIADLSSLQEIRRAADDLIQLKRPIDVLIHNAGVYLTKQELTPDGLDKVLVVHYLSSFMINHLLQDKLKSQGPCRIILVSSEGHRFAAWGLHLDDLNWQKHRYSGLKSYGSAKTAQLLSMRIFEERFAGSGVTINAMHPGAVKTETGQENGRLYRWYKRNVLDRGLKPPQVSAEALYYLGVSPEVAGVSGRFFHLTTEEIPAPPALDDEVARELWGVTLKMTGLSGDA